MDKDELELPSLPEVAVRIRDEAENQNVSASSLAAVIGEDPGLAARIIRVANSPMFRATRPIDDLNMALSRLGVEYAANLATGFAMQQAPWKRLGYQGPRIVSVGQHIPQRSA